MASSEERSLNKVQKRLKLRRDKTLVDTGTPESLDQNCERNGRSPLCGLLGNGRSMSNKRESMATQRKGKNSGNGRKLAARTHNRLASNETCSSEPPIDIPRPGPSKSNSDSDCITISDSSDDDNAASIRKPHVKLSIKQSPCAGSGDSWHVRSGSKSVSDYSNFGTYDYTVKREVVGSYATSRAVELLRKARDDMILLPDLANDDLPDLSSSLLESRKHHIAPEALNIESSSGEFAVVEQGATEKWNSSRKRYLKTRPSDAKSSSNKCVTTKHGKKVTAPCRRRIIPPGPSEALTSSDAMVGPSNDVSSSNETVTVRSGHKQNTKTAPTIFEISSDDEFTTSMYVTKVKGSRKRHFKRGPSKVESSSTEPVTSKCHHICKDSLINPRSSRSESRKLLTSKCGQTLNLTCTQHVKRNRSTLTLDESVTTMDDCECNGVPEQIDLDGSTDSDEPLTDVVRRKLEKMQKGASVPQTSDDVSACGENDTILALPAVKKSHTLNRRKNLTLHDDSEPSDSASSSDAAISCPPSTSRSRSASPVFTSHLLKKMENGEVNYWRMVTTSPPMDVDQSLDVTPYGKSPLHDDTGSCNDCNTNGRSPLVASSSETVVDQVIESRKEAQCTRSPGKQTVQVPLVDIMSCECADCSSVRNRFLTPRKDLATTEGCSAVGISVQSSESTQLGKNLNTTDPHTQQSQGKDTTSHCQEDFVNSVLSNAGAGSNIQEKRDILGDLIRMSRGSNYDPPVAKCNESKESTDDCDITDNLQQEVNGVTEVGEKDHCGALNEASDVPQSVEVVRSRGHTSDDDTEMVDVSRDDINDDNDRMEVMNVTKSKNDATDNNDDAEIMNVTKSVDDDTDNNADMDITNVTKSGGDTNDNGDDTDVTDAVFSQEDDVVMLLSDSDDNDDSIFANLTQLCVKSEPTSESEQEVERGGIAEILKEELGGSRDVPWKEGGGVVLGEVFVKSEPGSDVEQDLYDAGIYVSVGEQSGEDLQRESEQTLTSAVKTEPLEVTGSVELTVEAEPSDASCRTQRNGITREHAQDVTAQDEYDQDVTVREHRKERSPGDSSSPLRIRAAALDSILKSFEKRIPIKTCQSRHAVETNTEPCQKGDTSDTATKPCQPHHAVETTTQSKGLYDDGETPDFSEDDTATTDDHEAHGSSEDNNTFFVLPTSQKLSSFREIRKHSHGKHPHRPPAPATPKRKQAHLSSARAHHLLSMGARHLSPMRAHHISPMRARHLSPVRARHLSPVRACRLSPLKADMFYPRRRTVMLPNKGLSGRSSVLTWARNRKQRMPSSKAVDADQLSRQEVRNAQTQMKAREELRKNYLVRAKSASVQQRFMSRSDALLQDMTRAIAKPLSSITSRQTTMATEHISTPAVEASAANAPLKSASLPEESVPPGGESSNQNLVAPPVAKRPNCAQQESVTKKVTLTSKTSSPHVVPPGSERRLWPVAQTASSRSLSVDSDLLLRILRWNANWLSEQQAFHEKEPPVVGSMKIWPLLDSYDSFDQYVDIVMPLLLLETWQSVQRDWMEKRPGSERHMVLVDANIIPNKHIDLVYQGALTSEKEKTSRPIWKNDLLVLDLCLAHRDGRTETKPVFGLVTNVTRNRKQKLHPLIAKDVKDNDSVVTQISVRLYYRQYRIDEKKHMKITIISSLSTAIHQFGGLMSLPRSSLCRDILRPVNEQVFLSSLPDATTETSSQQLQQRVAQSAAECALGPPILPRICLIQGPPGTGKTTTIINIISRILSSAKEHGRDNKENSATQTPKILLCTPSNAAVDELMRRLIQKRIKDRKDSRRTPLQPVRVGRCADDVSAYSLEARTKVRMQEVVTSTCPSSMTRAMESIRSKISALEQNYEIFLAARNDPEANKTKEERDRQKERLQKLEMSLTSKTGHVVGFQASEQAARRDVLLNADVVCCTLNSCGSDSMLHLIPTKSADATTNPRMPHFTCVIVDEAAQCVELDCLIPLQFRCSKMILVGDQQQLPATVISEKAMENNYNQSLFDRFYNYFLVSQRWQHKPIQVLDLQFRMHPEICLFPSQHFYDGQLKTDPKIKPRREKFPCQHYLLFDIAYGEEQQETAGGISNKMEADFVIELCEYLMGHAVQPRNIGIITPYRKQKELIKRFLCQRGQQDIDIDTVDGFQGREKDVIVVSCVRARNTAGTIGFLKDKRRMNVALTRAKYALYVTGRVSSLQMDPHWRQLIENAKERRLVVKVNSASDARRVICESCKKPQSHKSTGTRK